MGQPKLDTSDFIDSNVNLHAVFMSLIEKIRFSKWEVWCLNWTLQIKKNYPFISIILLSMNNKYNNKCKLKETTKRNCRNLHVMSF